MDLLDVTFLIIYFTVPISVWYVLKKSGISLLNLSVPVFVIQTLFLLAYVGYFFLYFKLDEYRVEDGVIDKEVIFQAFSFSAYTLFTFTLGVVFCSGVVKANFNLSKLDRVSLVNRKELIWLVVLLVIVALVLALYVSKVSKLAIVVALVDGFSEAKLARSDMSNNFSGKYHWYSLFMHDVSAFVSYSLFGAWFVSKKKLIGVIAFFSFLLTSFAMIMSTEKAPLVWFFLGVFFTYILCRKKGELSVRRVVPLALIGLAVLLSADVLFMGSSEFGSALSSIISRAMTGGITPSYFYIEFFPDHQEYLQGRSFPNPGQLLPFEPYSMTVEVMNWIHPEHLDMDIVGTAPTVFWAELYANFGAPGVLIAPVVLGFVLSFFVYFFNKLKTSPITIAMTVWMMLHYKDLAATGISGFIFDIRLYTLLLIVVVVLATSHQFKLLFNRSSILIPDNSK